MRRSWVAAWTGLLLVGMLSATAFAQDADMDASKPPAELAEYFAQARKADAIKDPEQRCLAYPDLPGNRWPEGAAAGSCAYASQEVGFSLDELQAMLAEPDGAGRLEIRMQALLEAHYSDPRQRDRIFRVFSSFDGELPAGAVATTWLRKAPRSPFAMTAMGTHRANQGWEARGGDWIRNTSEPQLQRMRQQFTGAIPLLVEALELEPRLTPACMELTQIGRMSSDSLQQHFLAQCLQVDPLSYYLVAEWMSSAKPKWGGSLNDMAVVAAYARKHGPQNPRLYALLGEPTGYPATQAKTYGKGKAGYVAASRAGPGAAMMRDAGRASQEEGEDPWNAIMYWSQVLRFWPDDMEIRKMRGMVLYSLRRHDLALGDLLPAATAAPDDLKLQFAAGVGLLMTGRPQEARPYLQRILGLEGQETGALEGYCQTFIFSPGQLATPQALDCTARLVELGPTRGLYWYWRYMALAEAQDPGWADAATKLILYANRFDPSQESLRKHLLANGVER